MVMNHLKNVWRIQFFLNVQFVQSLYSRAHVIHEMSVEATTRFSILANFQCTILSKQSQTFVVLRQLATVNAVSSRRYSFVKNDS